MKKHKFKILTFVAVAAALAGTGCFKSIGYETFYVLRPWAQEGTVKTPIPREDMLAYAFDTLQCIRVQIKTDARNPESQRSLEALGATYEGRLRHHIITPSGRIRDSLYYAITDADWPVLGLGRSSQWNHDE